jgi:hypothetical protein
MTAPKSTISTKSDNVGNAGTINIAAQENITTGILTSEANNKRKKPMEAVLVLSAKEEKLTPPKQFNHFPMEVTPGMSSCEAKQTSLPTP